jgi:ElaB/YqjD/DUF883 family membrane-anchored ribosome-binding protein
MADDLTNEIPAGVSHVEEQAVSFTADLPQASADPAQEQQASGNAGDRVRTLRQNADRYVRENPTKAVFTALGIGFVCGLIYRH